MIRLGFLSSILLYIVSPSIVCGQVVVQSWYVTDGGGSVGTSPELVLYNSLAQSAVQSGSSADLSLMSGYVPGIGKGSALLLQQLSTSWNMISISLFVSDYRRSILYPSASSQAFSYQAGYTSRETLQLGMGYWLKFPSDTSIVMAGSVDSTDTIMVTANWNMIGAISSSVPISSIISVPPLIVTSGTFYGYSSNTGYYSEDTLQPGKAYWVKVSSAGKLIVTSGGLTKSATSIAMTGAKGSPPDVPPFLSQANVITVTDAIGRSKALSYGTAGQVADMDQFELPPSPPAGIFDVRYGSNRWYEFSQMGEPKEIPVIITGARFPLSISWKGHASATLIVDGIKYSLVHANEVRIANPASRIILHLSRTTPLSMATDFSLSQNYPNPFNPVTVIRYSLPVSRHVSLKIYNVLGQLVSVLVDELQDVGSKTVEWNAGNMPSGIYYYQLTSGPFTQAKKLMLLK